MKWYWLVWIAIGFGVPESIALIRHRTQDTLSAQVWDLEGHGWTATRYAVLAFLVWLLIHFVWEALR